MNYSMNRNTKLFDKVKAMLGADLLLDEATNWMSGPEMNEWLENVVRYYDIDIEKEEN